MNCLLNAAAYIYIYCFNYGSSSDTFLSSCRIFPAHSDPTECKHSIDKGALQVGCLGSLGSVEKLRSDPCDAMSENSSKQLRSALSFPSHLEFFTRSCWTVLCMQKSAIHPGVYQELDKMETSASMASQAHSSGQALLRNSRPFAPAFSSVNISLYDGNLVWECYGHHTRAVCR